MSATWKWRSWTACTILGLASFALAQNSPAASSSAPPHYGRVRLRFEQNVGQADSRLRFLARNGRAIIGLHERGVHLAYATGAPEAGTVPMAGASWGFVGAQAAALEGIEPQPRQSFYFQDRSDAALNARTFSAVRQRSIYPGIDVVYYGDPHGRLEHDFIVQPGGDPARIVLRFTGADSLRITPQGELAIGLAGEELRLKRPIAYQEVNGLRHQVQAAFVLKEDLVRFSLGHFDRTKPLVIDPVLVYSTLLGGASLTGGGDIVQTITADAAGSLYLIGTTGSSDFPVTFGSFSAPAVVYVTKLNSSGSGIVYSAFFRGSAGVIGAKVNAAGELTIAGAADANWPTTAGSYKPVGSGWFVTRLTAFGNGLVFSTYLTDTIAYSGAIMNAMTVDSAGNTIVVGQASGLPIATAGAYQAAARNALLDGFLIKLNNTGSAVTFGTYFGGTGADTINYVGTDSSNNVIVVGGSDSNDLPTAGTPVAARSTGSQGFTARFNSSGTTLQYGSFLPDAGLPPAATFDATGNVYVLTSSARKISPTGTVLYTQALATSGVPIQAHVTAAGVLYFQGAGSGNPINGIHKVPADGSAESLVVSGNAEFFTLDSAGNLYKAGHTSSAAFPTTANAFQSSLRGPQDVYAMKFTEAASTGAVRLTQTGLDFGTILLGSTSVAQTVVMINTGGAAIAVSTVSATTDFLVNSACSGTLQAFSSCTVSIQFRPTTSVLRAGTLTITSNAPGSPHTVALAGLGVGPRLSVSPDPIDFGAQTVSVVRNQTVTLTNIGNAAGVLGSIASTNPVFAVTSRGTCPADGGTINAGNSCTIQVGFTPAATGTVGGTLAFGSPAPNGFFHSVELYGVGGETVSVTPDPFNFGDTYIGANLDRFVTIRNNTNQTMTLNLAGSADNTQFPVLNSSSCTANTVLAGQNSCQLPLRFSPVGTAGNRQTFLNVRYTLSGAPTSPVDKQTTLQGRVINPLSVNPPSITFPATATNQASIAPITITNSSPYALTLGYPTIPHYAFGFLDCPQPLPSGASCAAQIRYAPTSVGTHTTQISLTQQAGAPISFTVPVAVTGQGVAPALVITPSQVQPPLSTYVVGTQSALVNITLANGSSAISLSGFSIENTFPSPADPPYWQIASTTCGATLNASASCVVSVRFTPPVQQQLRSNFVIHHSGPGSPQSIQMLGVAVNGNVYFSPAPLDFGSVLLGTSEALAVTVTNNLTTPITISNVAATGAFTQSSNCIGSIAAKATCTVSVSFSPGSIGLLNGTLSVTSNAGGSPHSLTLMGVGTNSPGSTTRSRRPPKPM